MLLITSLTITKTFTIKINLIGTYNDYTDYFYYNFFRWQWYELYNFKLDIGNILVIFFFKYIRL